MRLFLTAEWVKPQGRHSEGERASQEKKATNAIIKNRANPHPRADNKSWRLSPPRLPISKQGFAISLSQRAVPFVAPKNTTGILSGTQTPENMIDQVKYMLHGCESLLTTPSNQESITPRTSPDRAGVVKGQQANVCMPYT